MVTEEKAKVCKTWRKGYTLDTTKAIGITWVLEATWTLERWSKYIKPGKSCTLDTTEAMGLTWALERTWTLRRENQSM